MLSISRRLMHTACIHPPIFAKTIEVDGILALFHKRVAAVHIREFLPKDVCNHASAILLSGKIKDYTNAPGIGRVGIAYFETTDNEEMMKEYLSSARANIESLRRVFSPYISPIDLMRLKCDEAWPYGAHLSRIGSAPKFVGLCRSLEVGKGILPHEDKLERDDPSRGGLPLWGQISFNVYLQPVQEGGQLQLWSRSLSDNVYNSLRGESYGIDRAHLPPPEVIISPEQGDLVLFNPTNLHAVQEVTKTRLSVSAFIGCEGPGQPLKFWS